MAHLCGSCGTACAPDAARCPVCGRTVLALSAAPMPAGQTNGYLISRGRVGWLAAPASSLLLLVAALIWVFGFPSPGFGQSAAPPSQTPPALDQPASTVAALTPSGATPVISPGAAASATATIGPTGPGGATPTPTSRPDTPTATARPSPTNSPTPKPTPTYTPISGGG